MGSPEEVGSSEEVGSPEGVGSPDRVGSGGPGVGWTFLPSQVLKCDAEMK